MDYLPFYSPYADALSADFFSVVLVLILWTILLKGPSLWYAARGGQKGWFIALLLINTIGILEIIYLIWFRPKHTPHTHPHHEPRHTSSSRE